MEYLGAESPNISSGLVDNQEIDYESMDQQYSQLVEKINNKTNRKIPKNILSQESSMLKCSVSVKILI